MAAPPNAPQQELSVIYGSPVQHHTSPSTSPSPLQAPVTATLPGCTAVEPDPCPGEGDTEGVSQGGMPSTEMMCTALEAASLEESTAQGEDSMPSRGTDEITASSPQQAQPPLTALDPASAHAPLPAPAPVLGPTLSIPCPGNPYAASARPSAPSAPSDKPRHGSRSAAVSPRVPLFSPLSPGPRGSSSSGAHSPASLHQRQQQQQQFNSLQAFAAGVSAWVDPNALPMDLSSSSLHRRRRDRRDRLAHHALASASEPHTHSHSHLHPHSHSHSHSHLHSLSHSLSHPMSPSSPVPLQLGLASTGSPGKGLQLEEGLGGGETKLARRAQRSERLRGMLRDKSARLPHRAAESPPLPSSHRS